MADWNELNLHIGEGNLSLKGPDDAVPVFVGACQDHTLDSSPKLLEVECGQSQYSIEVFKIKDSIKGSIDLVEATMRNMIVAFGGNPGEIVEDVDKYTYTIKGAMTAPVNYELVYSVPRPYDNTKSMIITFYKIRSTGGLKLSFKKEKESRIKFEYTALADSTQSNDVGTIVLEKYQA